MRDGLKPVQRRILYTMWQQNLTADAKHRKCAKVVGDVMGNYHPHGDAAIYETLVRMAQSFSLRVPLVDGSGNFGSLDGDAPRRCATPSAASRASPTRCCRRSSSRRSRSVPTTTARAPSRSCCRRASRTCWSTAPPASPSAWPPTSRRTTSSEVCTALIKLLDNQELTSAQLCRYIKGPDFPDRRAHPQLAGGAEGDLQDRPGHRPHARDLGERPGVARQPRSSTSPASPTRVNKAQLVERIGDVVLSRKMPHLVDVKDLSTDDVRIELELKAGADENLVMAYLFKNTPLQTTFAVNMTCLVPTENEQVGRPERLELHQMLWYFLHFRLEVVTSRLEHELEQLQRRIHILEGFEKVFDALDEIIRIIRKSDGKADAAEKIIKRFELDAEQTDAILELKLYRLARLEILVIQNELADKRKRARQINALLKDEDARWKLVRDELEEVQKKYGEPRRTRIEETEEVEYSADAFIVEEDNVVIVSRDGWVKRQKEVKDLSTTRLREGDSVLAAVAGSTRATVGVLQQLRRRLHGAHRRRPGVDRLRRADPEAVQAEGRRAGDRRAQPRSARDRRDRRRQKARPAEPPVHAIAVTSDGYALRFSLEPFVEPSTRAGRRYARAAEGAEVVAVSVTTGDEVVIAATADARALLCKADEVNFLSGPGRGVILIKVNFPDDKVIGAQVSTGDRDLMTVETSRGAEQTISTAKYEVTGRGGKGRELLQRGQFVRVLPTDVTVPTLGDDS